MIHSVEWARFWLPKQLFDVQFEGTSSVVLIGWVNAGFKSVDIVVAATCSDAEIECARAKLQEDLNIVETKLPAALQNGGRLCIVGECLIKGNHHIEERGAKGSNELVDGSQEETAGIGKSSKWYSKLQSSEGGEQLDFRSNWTESSTSWAVLSASNVVSTGEELDCIPNIQCLYLNGKKAQVRRHIVVYQQPVAGSHHFSCVPWQPLFQFTHQKSLAQISKSTVRKPEWLSSLEQQQSLDLELVMMELNHTTFVQEFFNISNTRAYTGIHQTTRSTISSISFEHLRHVGAAFIAVWATLLCAVAQVLFRSLVRMSTFPYLGYLLQRSMTWQTLRIRCQQLMAWPFILLWGGLGPYQPNVASTHRLRMSRASTWSVLIVDYVLGASAGYLVVRYHDAILQLATHAGKTLTNDVLRIGCVWLMGIPAGLKLNNELAAAIGTLSLHVIQSWSTLFHVLLPAVKVFLQASAFVSILLGFTVFAAMISDMLFMATLHVLCLHHGIAFLHKIQLQALAALWRLFRGRKRNPLRRKVDSYDCSVEQLVVGSLLFTPLLLLLPTTSVFYTYFSIIFLSLFGAHIVLYYLIAMVHSVPVALLVTWVVNPRQFPSGIWIRQLGTTHINDKDGEGLRSILGIRPASLGELAKPYLVNLWVAPKWSSSATFFRKVVSGNRYNLRLRLGHTVSLPFSPISPMRFAWLCYTAVAGKR